VEDPATGTMTTVVEDTMLEDPLVDDTCVVTLLPVAGPTGVGATFEGALCTVEEDEEDS